MWNVLFCEADSPKPIIWFKIIQNTKKAADPHISRAKTTKKKPFMHQKCTKNYKLFLVFCFYFPLLSSANHGITSSETLNPWRCCEFLSLGFWDLARFHHITAFSNHNLMVMMMLHGKCSGLNLIPLQGCKPSILFTVFNTALLGMRKCTDKWLL